VRVLLDTQMFLWCALSPGKLRTAARTAIENAEEVFVSSASVWEAAIKVGRGKLEVDIGQLVSDIEEKGFKELPVSSRHAALVAALPHHHRDPFDRLLVAQAMQEPMRLLTSDPMLAAYTPLVEVI